MANHNVKQLQKDWCDEYDGDVDDLRDFVDDEGHFEDIALWVTKSLGYSSVLFSEVQLSFYEDDWTESDCSALGKIKKLVWQLDDAKSNCEYLIHAIVEAPNWTLGRDNKEAKQKQVMALCITGDSGDENVYSSIHMAGKCPECLYEHEIMIDKKIKVTATFYIRVKGKDKYGKFQQVFDDAIDGVLSKNTIEDNLYDEMYYEMDDEITIEAKRHRVSQVRVPRTRQI